MLFWGTLVFCVLAALSCLLSVAQVSFCLGASVFLAVILAFGFEVVLAFGFEVVLAVV